MPRPAFDAAFFLMVVRWLIVLTIAAAVLLAAAAVYGIVRLVHQSQQGRLIAAVRDAGGKVRDGERVETLTLHAQHSIQGHPYAHRIGMAVTTTLSW